MGKTECFAGISRKGLIRETLAKTNCPHLSWLFVFQSCAGHMLHFAGRLLASYPQKLLALHFALSLHTLSHTQPLQWNLTLNIGYIRLNIITIKFGIELKPTQNSCKSQLYTWLLPSLVHGQWSEILIALKMLEKRNEGNLLLNAQSIVLEPSSLIL